MRLVAESPSLIRADQESSSRSAGTCHCSGWAWMSWLRRSAADAICAIAWSGPTAVAGSPNQTSVSPLGPRQLAAATRGAPVRAARAPTACGTTEARSRIRDGDPKPRGRRSSITSTAQFRWRSASRVSIRVSSAFRRRTPSRRRAAENRKCRQAGRRGRVQTTGVTPHRSASQPPPRSKSPRCTERSRTPLPLLTAECRFSSPRTTTLL